MEFEFKKVSGNTYYFIDTNRVVLYKTGEKSVVLLDSGKNKKAAIKILDVINSYDWTLEAIYLSHSHADHMGGAAYLKDQTGCKVYCPAVEIDLTISTFLEPSFIFGGNPPHELCLPFLRAEPCKTELMTEDVLPKGISMIALPGHTYNMYGFKTDDNVYFLADAYVGSEILSNHPISYLYEVGKYLDTLEMLEKLNGAYYIAAHAVPSNDIHPVIKLNRDNVLEIMDAINKILKEEPCSFDKLLAKLFTHFNLLMNFIQHYLVGCTIKSYLNYMREEKKIDTKVVDNQLLWYAL
ncbi:MAG: MBL fold metallo-hydrolase [Sphaerochaeta sp.]